MEFDFYSLMQQATSNHETNAKKKINSIDSELEKRRQKEKEQILAQKHKPKVKKPLPTPPEPPKIKRIPKVSKSTVSQPPSRIVETKKETKLAKNASKLARKMSRNDLSSSKKLNNSFKTRKESNEYKKHTETYRKPSEPLKKPVQTSKKPPPEALKKSHHISEPHKTSTPSTSKTKLGSSGPSKDAISAFLAKQKTNKEKEISQKKKEKEKLIQAQIGAHGGKITKKLVSQLHLSKKELEMHREREASNGLKSVQQKGPATNEKLHVEFMRRVQQDRNRTLEKNELNSHRKRPLPQIAPKRETNPGGPVNFNELMKFAAAKKDSPMSEPKKSKIEVSSKFSSKIPEKEPKKKVQRKPPPPPAVVHRNARPPERGGVPPSAVHRNARPPDRGGVPPSAVHRNRPPDRVVRSPPHLPQSSAMDSDSEYDSDLADFIDDTPLEQDHQEELKNTLKQLYKYDRRKYMNEPKHDDKSMEASFRDISREEAKSARLALLEDLREYKKGSTSV